MRARGVRKIVFLIWLACAVQFVLAQSPRSTPAPSSQSAGASAAKSATNRNPANPGKPTYNQLISAGYDALRDGNVKKAYLAALEAAKTDPQRFESYALAALALHEQGSDSEAKTFVSKAVVRAPKDKQAKLAELASAIEKGSQEPEQTAQQDERVQRQLDGLQIIIEDADKATSTASRKQLLQEFLEKSAPFVAEHPDQTDIWTLRAAAALEIEDTKAGWEAGRNLLQSGKPANNDPKVRKVLARLERAGWLGEKAVPSIDENRSTIFSSFWRCEDPGLGTYYLNYAYAEGVWTEWTSLGHGTKRTQRYKTDGSLQQSKEKDCTRSARYTWNAMVLKKVEEIACEADSSREKSEISVESDALTEDGIAEFTIKGDKPSSSHSTFRCERSTRKDYDDDVKRANSTAQAFADFLKANASKVTAASVDGCKFHILSPDSDPVVGSFTVDTKYSSVELLSPPSRGFGLQYVGASSPIPFESEDNAEQALQLYRKAATLCDLAK